MKRRQARPEVFGTRLAGGSVSAELQADGTVRVRDLPIFSEVREDDPGAQDGSREVRDRAWLEQALAKNRARLELGHAPPMTLRHIFDDPERVGTYELTRLDLADVNPGEEPRWTLFGDKVYESQEAFEKSKRYDYRSPEISPDAPDELAALALLRDKAPFNKYPNVTEKLDPALAEAFQSFRSRGGSVPQTWRGRMETFALGPRPSDPSSISFDPKNFVQEGVEVEWVVPIGSGGTGYPKRFSDEQAAKEYGRRVGREPIREERPKMKRVAWSGSGYESSDETASVANAAPLTFAGATSPYAIANAMLSKGQITKSQFDEVVSAIKREEHEAMASSEDDEDRRLLAIEARDRKFREANIKLRPAPSRMGPPAKNNAPFEDPHDDPNYETAGGRDQIAAALVLLKQGLDKYATAKTISSDFDLSAADALEVVNAALRERDQGSYVRQEHDPDSYSSKSKGEAFTVRVGDLVNYHGQARRVESVRESDGKNWAHLFSPGWSVDAEADFIGRYVITDSTIKMGDYLDESGAKRKPMRSYESKSQSPTTQEGRMADTKAGAVAEKPSVDQRLEKLESMMTKVYEAVVAKREDTEKETEDHEAAPEDEKKPEKAEGEPDKDEKKKPETAGSAGPNELLPPAVSEMRVGETYSAKSRNGTNGTANTMTEVFSAKLATMETANLGLKARIEKMEREKESVAHVANAKKALADMGVPQVTEAFEAALSRAALKSGKAGCDELLESVKLTMGLTSRSPEAFGVMAGSLSQSGQPDDLKKAIESFAARPEQAGKRSKITELFTAYMVADEGFRRSVPFYDVCRGRPDINDGPGGIMSDRGGRA